MPSSPREFWRLSRAGRENIREVAGVAYAGLGVEPSGHKPARGDRVQQVHNAIFGGDADAAFAADAALRARDGIGRENVASRKEASSGSSPVSAGQSAFWHGGSQHDRRGGRHHGGKDRPDRGEHNPGGLTPPAALEDPTVYLGGGGDLWESSTSPAFMGLYRTGDLSQSLTVNIAMNGTATAGVDYQNVPDTVTFYAWQSSVLLPIYAINDTTR